MIWWTVDQGIPNTLETTLYDDGQPKKEDQGLYCGTPSMSPILLEKVQKHCHRLSAQPEVLSGVLMIKKPVQNRDGHVHAAVQGSGLDWERERTGKVKWLIRARAGNLRGPYCNRNDYSYSFFFPCTKMIAFFTA